MEFAMTPGTITVIIIKFNVTICQHSGFQIKCLHAMSASSFQELAFDLEVEIEKVGTGLQCTLIPLSKTLISP